MSRPIVIAHHLIWTAYGWWLPNDPRGSTSRTIASDMIADLGELHFGRRRVQPSSSVLREHHERAGNVLKYPLVRFDASQIETISAGLAEGIAENRYTCYACAVMRDHVHLVIRKHKHQAEEMIDRLQRCSRLRLIDPSRDAAPAVAVDHPVWTEGGWKVFLDHPDDVRRTIPYVEGNPAKHGLPPQRWSFVTEYDGWPLHPGHSPNSPYARRLREARR